MAQIKVADALQNGLEASPEKETLHPPVLSLQANCVRAKNMEPLQEGILL